MTLLHLITREILHHKLSFSLGIVSVIVAVGVLVGELTLLDTHDLQTQQIHHFSDGRGCDRQEIVCRDIDSDRTIALLFCLKLLHF